MQDWTKTVPLGIHGDGGAFSHQDSLMTISWNSLVGSGSTILKRFLITEIRKSEKTPGTLDAILRIASWSFNALLRGETPTANHLGLAIAKAPRPLADGWCGALCQVRGDWQFHCETFGFPQWNSAE